MILSEKILWRVSLCLPFNFVGHCLRLEKTWFLKILYSGNSLPSINVKTKGQNLKILTGSYLFGYQGYSANGSRLLLLPKPQPWSAGTGKASSFIGKENHEELADLILIGRSLNLSEECKRKIRSGLLNESRENLQYSAIPFAITPLLNICESQKPIPEKSSVGLHFYEIMQNIPLALISLL